MKTDLKTIYHYFEVELPKMLDRLPLGKECYIGIYGIGIHTGHLLQRYQEDVGQIKAKIVFIDSKKPSLSEKYKGYDVYNVNDIGNLPLDAIILSSSIYENEMLETIRTLYGSRFQIFHFYQGGQKDIFFRYGLVPESKTAWKKKIKVNFVDFWPNFDSVNNFIMQLLFSQYKLEISEEPDVLFCSHFGKVHQKYKDCIKVFIVTEVRPFEFFDYDYVIGYPYLDDRRFFHYSIYAPRNDLVKLVQDRNRFSDISFAQRKFCNFIYSNEVCGEGALIRKQFCMELSSYKHIDCPGKVLNNMTGVLASRESAECAAAKKEFIKQYKFTIAFENHMADGYTTEKLWDPFIAGSIPIYWGNPSIGREVCSEAFINCNDFDNDFNAVIKRVREIDEDDEYYMYMLGKAPLRNPADWGNEKLNAFLNHVILDL